MDGGVDDNAKAGGGGHRRRRDGRKTSTASRPRPDRIRRRSSLGREFPFGQFAGGTADAFTLFDFFEQKLEQHGQLQRAAIELAKDWRSDRTLRRLEALLVVADKDQALLISGTGDVIEPEHPLLAIGSGGPYAQASAQALLQNTDLDARSIVEKSLTIAGEICVYTNQQILIEEL